ncbi:MAG: aminotransferase class V-fold PLP-dependent enzyme, partial [Acidimicrobiia bacterium]|nr:aminotransferase class V-fold PLP-dependent enzyme [Acidimicrobiia bacterium]MDX2465877.1 aminotransferase class V-fold PLP-dependent enzyme [Acidimicrobiia bacterium]
GIVTFSVAGHSAQEVKAVLARAGINVSTTSVYLARIDMEQRGLDEVVRSSVHYFNTQDEIEALVATVATLA